jgi:predicted nucleotidyltransferase
MLQCISDFCEEVVKSNPSSIREIILYGSYARGENNDESDIDIMTLVDSDSPELRVRIIDIASDIGLDSGYFISPTIVAVDTFREWPDHLPFYRNVVHDGQILYRKEKRHEL